MISFIYRNDIYAFYLSVNPQLTHCIIQMKNKFNEAYRIPNNNFTAKVAHDTNQDATNSNENFVVPTHSDVQILERCIIQEMNLVRLNPGKYANLYILPMLEQFDGDILLHSNGTRIRTIEGITAVQECANALESHRGSHPLSFSIGMTKGARDHLNDQSNNGGIGHRGSDGSSPGERVNRFGHWGITVAENISYGYKAPRDIVISLLVDDGVKNRGHRKTILSDEYSVTGVAFGSHPQYQTMCVITYAGYYTEMQ